VTVLAPGTPAPEFSLADEQGGRFTQADLLGHKTVLVFYPFAFSAPCSEQLSVYEEVLGELAAQDARIFAVSCDAGYSQTAFREQLNVTIGQLSDFEPKGAVCTAFGVLHEGGFAQRALVIVGPDGIIKWSYQAASLGDLPGANLIFDGLAA